MADTPLPPGAGSTPAARADEEEPLSAWEAATSEEIATSGEDALAAAGEAPRLEVEEPLPSGSGSTPAAPADEEAPPSVWEAATSGETATSGEDALAAAGEAPRPEADEPGLPAPERRPAARADSLQETRSRIRKALGADAAIVDLRVPRDEAGAAFPATSDVRRVADLLASLTSPPHLPDGEAGRGRVDVNACIDEAVRATGAKAAAEVETDLRPIPGVSASKADVRLLLAEIVENSVLAVQAQDERRPTIRIHTSRRNDEVLVTIIDNGVGIPADVREAVFHPFRTSRDGSIGVGLTLARCLAEKHEGAVHINSSLHHGTVARITLPIERPVH